MFVSGASGKQAIILLAGDIMVRVLPMMVLQKRKKNALAHEECKTLQTTFLFIAKCLDM